MPDQEPTGQNDQGGGPLREKFEATRKLAVDLMIQTNKGLTASDFNGVEPDQFVEHAAALKQRAREIAAAEAAANPPPPAEDDGADDDEETPQQRTANLSGLSARPASFDPEGDEDRGLWGRDLIRSALERDEKRKR